jgi:hypothetical protein
MTIKPVLVPDQDAATLRRLMDAFADASTGPTRQELTESRSAVAAAQGVAEGSAGWMLRQDPELAKKVRANTQGYKDLKKMAGKPVPKKDEKGVSEDRPDVMRHTGDKTIKIVKRAGKPIGEIGIDAEASSGNGQYYVKLYDGSYDAVGYDTAEEALAELKAAIKSGVTEGMQTHRDYVKPDDPDVINMAKMAARGLLTYAAKTKMNPANLLKKDYYALAEMLEKVNPQLYATIDGQLSDNDYNWLYFKAAALAASAAAKQGVAEVSDNTLKSYQQKVSNDSMKNDLDPTKRSPEKRNRSVSGVAKAHNRLEKGVAEGSMYGDEEVSWEKGGRRAPTGAFRNPAVVKTDKSIGTRVSDIGAGGKEYNVKTDKEWDKQSAGMAEAEAKGPFARVKTETLQQFWDSHKDEQNPAPVLADKLKRIRQELVRRKRADVTEDEVEEGWKSKLAAAGLAGAAALGGYAAGSSSPSTGFSNTKGIDQFNKPTAAQVQPSQTRNTGSGFSNTKGIDQFNKPTAAQGQTLRTQADLDAYNKTRPPGTSKLVNLPKDFEEDIAESIDPVEQLRADIRRFSR